MVEQSAEQELKRLQPVAASAAAAATTAGSLYTRAKAYVPQRLQGTVEAAEGRVADLAAPYLPALLDRGASALRAVDAKVDSTLLSAHGALKANSSALAAAVEQQRAAVLSGGAATLDQLAAARAAYLERVEAAVGALKEQGLQGTAKAAAESVLSKVGEARAALPALPNPHAVLGEVEAVWGRFVALPAVERLLLASRGGVEAAWARYSAAHDAVVADPRYASAVSRGSELLVGLQASAAYRAASARLGPWLAPYAEAAGNTALAKAAEPYVRQVAAHLAPAVAAS